MRSMIPALMTLGLFFGCFQPSSPLATHAPFAELTALSNAEVTGLTQSVDQPLIVEFSVPHGCVRCAEMRPKVERIASEQSASISIKRADFVANQPLLQSLGATVCPTYVLFTPNAPPQIHTSPDILISMASHSTVAGH
jgi:hypothetical protein